mmetsp:Transcript_106344/g.343039  ORF Transcript_106344/g.343039 Transcript_106344/m.343039 type:complete len:379 (-) Transcript_106344:32-1168(-)
MLAMRRRWRLPATELYTHLWRRCGRLPATASAEAWWLAAPSSCPPLSFGVEAGVSEHRVDHLSKQLACAGGRADLVQLQRVVGRAADVRDVDEGGHVPPGVRRLLQGPVPRAYGPVGRHQGVARLRLAVLRLLPRPGLPRGQRLAAAAGEQLPELRRDGRRRRGLRPGEGQVRVEVQDRGAALLRAVVGREPVARAGRATVVRGEDLQHLQAPLPLLLGQRGGAELLGAVGEGAVVAVATVAARPPGAAGAALPGLAGMLLAEAGLEEVRVEEHLLLGVRLGAVEPCKAEVLHLRRAVEASSRHPYVRADLRRVGVLARLPPGPLGAVRVLALRPPAADAVAGEPLARLRPEDVEHLLVAPKVRGHRHVSPGQRSWAL